MKPIIHLLITDLDNTLYDWVSYFAVAFERMIDATVELLKVDRDTLLDDCQRVHREHHNTEQPFAILDAAIVRTSLTGLSREGRLERLRPVFTAFDKSREDTLRLYAGVARTLALVQQRGCKIVGHTEAAVAPIRSRLRRLGLTRYFESVYAIIDVGEGHPLQPRSDSVSRPALQIRPLAHSQRKPDPTVLLRICSDHGVDPSSALYVGDSISRDIGMAAAAGTHSAWAQYGTQYEAESWRTIVRVSHWSHEDVRAAQHAERIYGGARPEVTLRNAFSEILEHFDLRCGDPSAPSQLRLRQRSRVRRIDRG
jgi:phosphoglycolate phosphatase